ncbi:MAG: dienelactone hydrolase family protein [Kiritimatiellae bacterium]|nr:dienelactone hydrolase family protein [Kiritimatiellia bacterium]
MFAVEGLNVEGLKVDGSRSSALSSFSALLPDASGLSPLPLPSDDAVRRFQSAMDVEEPSNGAGQKDEGRKVECPLSRKERMDRKEEPAVLQEPVFPLVQKIVSDAPAAPTVRIAPVSPEQVDALAPVDYFTASDGTALPYRLHVPALPESLQVEGSKLEGSTSSSPQREKTADLRLSDLRPSTPSPVFPLVLFMHGAGTRGDDGKAFAGNISFQCLLSQVTENTPAIVLAPQCPDGEKWVNTPWGEKVHDFEPAPSRYMGAALELLDRTLATQPIDRSRILVCGNSMGGYATWDVVSRRPGLFAAALPVCGGGDAAKMPEFDDIPVWAVHGGADGTVPVENSRALVSGLRANPARSAETRYTEIPDAGHDVWTYAFSDPQILSWFFSKTRAATAPSKAIEPISVEAAAALCPSRLYTAPDGSTIPYRVHIPENAADAAARAGAPGLPLILFLHGAGERGADTEPLVRFPTIRHLLARNAMVEDAERAIVIAPQCPAEERWVDTSWGETAHVFNENPAKPLSLALSLLDHAVETLPVDRSRVYVCGVSMGGYGTWDALARRPETFAAALPVCGGGSTEAVARAGQVPVWVFHGAEDTVVPPDNSRNLVAAMRDDPARTAETRYREFPDVGHDSWLNAFSSPEVLGWLFAQRREGQGDQLAADLRPSDLRPSDLRPSDLQSSVSSLADAIAAEIAATPALASGDGEIRIVLKPTMLDGSEIHLSARTGELTVAITPATPEAAALVAAALPHLETALAAHSRAFHHVAISIAPAKKGRNDETA